MQKEGAMIEFVPKGKRQFTRLNSTYRTKEYIRVEPKWKKEHDFSSKKLISSFQILMMLQVDIMKNLIRSIKR
mgnify:FL=1